MKKRHLKRLGLILLACFLFLGLVGSVFAQGRADVVDWFVMASGGGQSANGTVSLNSTLGQPIAGSVSANDLTLESGYWHSWQAILLMLPLILK